MPAVGTVKVYFLDQIIGHGNAANGNTIAMDENFTSGIPGRGFL